MWEEEKVREGDRVVEEGRDKGRERDKGRADKVEVAETVCGIRGSYGATIIATVTAVAVGGDTIEETKTKTKIFVPLVPL